MNIFDLDFTKSEIDKYLEGTDLTEPAVHGTFELKMKDAPIGRLDNYMAVNFNVDEYRFPLLRGDGVLWMSLTPMEIQSNWVPIRRALHHDTIALLGLGMGYVPLRILAQHPNPEDLEIVIFEESEDAVELFIQLHAHKENFDKFIFIIGDAREKFKGFTVDYCYADIYPNQLDDAILEDLELFMAQNTIGEYRYWCQEMQIHEAYNAGEINDIKSLAAYNLWTRDDVEFLTMFYDSDVSNLRGYATPDPDTILTHLELMQKRRTAA